MMPRDRFRIAQEIEIEFVVERGVDGVRRRGKQKRVAVRRRPHHRLGRDIGAAARPVLDDEGLAEPFRKPLPHQARGEVRRAARGIPDDEADRPRWIGLRACDPGRGRERGSTERPDAKIDDAEIS